MIFHYFSNVGGLFLFSLAFLAMGVLAEKLIPSNIKNITQRLLIQISLGIVGWIYLIFFLAAAQIYYKPVFWTLMGIVLIAGGIYKRRTIVDFIKAPHGFPFRMTPAVAVYLFILAGIGMYYYVIGLLPRLCADAHGYHIYVPSRILATHGFYFIPFKPTSNWPLNMEMLFLGAMTIKDYILAHHVHYLTGVLTAVAIFIFCKDRQGRLAGMLAVVFYLMNDSVLWIFPTCYTDLGIAFFFFLSFWFINKAIDDPKNEKRLLLFAGIFAGAMAGAKLNAFIGGGILGFLFLAHRTLHRKFFSGLKNLLLFFVLPAALLLSPWLIKNIIFTGNPVYPFLYDIFGGQQWNQGLSEDMVRSHLNLGMGRKPIDYLWLPYRVIMNGEYQFSHFYGAINKAWLVLVPVTILFGLKKPAVRRALFVSLLYLYAWGLGTQQMRHFIPILTLLAVAAGITIAGLVSKIPYRRVKSYSKVVLLFGACFCLVWAAGVATHAYNSKNMGDKFLKRSPLHIGLEKYVHRQIPKDARILTPNGYLSLFLDREIINENLLGVAQVREFMLLGKTKRSIREAILQNGFEYILVDKRRRIKFPKMFKLLLKDTNYVKSIFRNPRFVLYQIQDPTEVHAEPETDKHPNPDHVNVINGKVFQNKHQKFVEKPGPVDEGQ